LQYPQESPKCSTQLPVKFDLHWSGVGGLTPAFQQFASAIESCQEFWSLIEEVDRKTWVLEPEKPTFAAKHRRIAISKELQ